MKLLDTNIFVYAQGRPGPFAEPCRAVLRRSEGEPEAYGVDVESLQELLDLYARRGAPAFGVRVVTGALDLFPDPFPISRAEIEEATDVFKGHRRLSPRDAIHAAVVFTYGLEGIVSADRGFDRVAGLTRFDPLELAAG
ncbi:MAG: type II toxin-antitoxin system VapC family toxin [Actinomycetota bacterium]